MQHASKAQPARPCSRRRALRLAGAAGLAALSASLLAACGNSGGQSSAAGSSAGTASVAAGSTASQATSGPATSGPAAGSQASSSGTATASAAAAGSGGATTITWSFWGDPNELPPNDEVIKAFNQKDPQIKIQTFHEPWANYFDKVQTMWASHTAPDVLFLTNVLSYASRDVLEPLDSYIKQSNYDVKDFVPAELVDFTYQGKIYGFPRDNDTKVLFYNKDAFDQAKIGYPDANWDWDNLRDAAMKLTTRSGSRVSRFGAAIESGEWPAFVWQNGAEVYDSATHPTKCLLDQPAQTQAITFLADLMNKDKVIPNATALNEQGGVTNMFGGGLAAMTITDAPRLLTFAKSTFKWNVSLYPKMKRHANYVGGAGYVMSSQSQHKDAAWTFCAFVNGPEAQTIFSKGGGVVPARISVQKSQTFLNSGPPGVDMQVFVTATANGHLNGDATSGPWAQELTQTVNKDLDLIWAGQKDPASQLKVTTQDADAKIQQLVK